MKYQVIVSLLVLIGLMSVQELHSQAAEQKEDSYAEIKWRSIGPFRGGRSCAVTGVVGQPNLYYFGSTGGGVWKSVNGGGSWENISDGYFGGSIGSIADGEGECLLWLRCLALRRRRKDLGKQRAGKIQTYFQN